MPRVFAERAIQAIDRDKCQTVGLNKLAHLLDIHITGEQLGPFRGIDAVKATVHCRRTGDPHMHLGGARFAHHLHDFQGRGAAHNRIVDQHDFLARHQMTVGVVLQFHAQMAHAVAWLDERATDVMRPDDAQFERDASGFGITDCSRRTAVRDGNDIVDIDSVFPCQFGTDCFANRIDAVAVDNRVGP